MLLDVFDMCAERPQTTHVPNIELAKWVISESMKWNPSQDLWEPKQTHMYLAAVGTIIGELDRATKPSDMLTGGGG